ncbi:uracil-DNA glycosylase [Xaviernesmea oryzae]|uniref:Uracil-DNA glycosylase n=1 Tax=Xaviernesmea oryzae TaxID=464029 RepID=A0A1Q9B0Q5_9HYPH|nr:uracil-DNA glycosylase family protein [Xaviernesmea oryzae]OLP61543.1 uracil-DNA glycosylase [Xaviernesmea oryzae]
MAGCRLCRDAPLGGPERALPHEPRPIFVLSARAPILIASQAPGIRAHDSGVPFNDPSGNRLRQWLGVDRDRFYDPDRFAILPMGFCFPGHDRHGGDLPPRKECAPAWRAEALAAMPGVRLILTIGAYAQAYHLGPKSSMTETVAGWRDILAATQGHNSLPAILPLPHPSWRNSAWLKRNPWFEADLVPELQRRVRTLISW